MPRDKTGHFYYGWYPEIYEADTQTLTLAEDGAYRRLLDAYRKTRSPLPNNDLALARIIGVGLDEWEKVKAAVLPYFKPTGLAGATLSHDFCDEELRLEHARMTKNQVNGSKGGKKKALNQKEILAVGNPVAYPNKTKQNQKEGLNKKPPYPLENVDNSVESGEEESRSLNNNSSSGLGRSGKPYFNIIDHLDEFDVSLCKSLVPQTHKWEVLIATYNSWVNEDNPSPPRNPNKAFPAWIRKYAKAKPPD